MVVERKKHISINWFERSDALVANLAAAALDFFLVSKALQRLEVKKQSNWISVTNYISIQLEQ